jgi:uroporphyrinogen-III synthase
MEARTKPTGFAGMRVLSLESRRAAEMTKLIETYGGTARVAPSMREVPLETNKEAQAFTRELLAGGFDMVILLTGVGTRALARVAEMVCPREEFVAALQRVPIVARGPKPVAALKELGLSVTLAVPEPNTWRELLTALDGAREALPVHGKRVAVQEYGAPNPELLAGLAERGAQVTQVPVYEWALPEDTQPLRDAVAVHHFDPGGAFTEDRGRDESGRTGPPSVRANSGRLDRAGDIGRTAGARDCRGLRAFASKNGILSE